MGSSVIIITGVAGSGKTTVGKALALQLNARFYDGDEFHPEANRQKMSAGIPLDDGDRIPWLHTLNMLVKEKLQTESLIIACSALKDSYRTILADGIDGNAVLWVHLQGSYELIHKRLAERSGHFMKPGMLLSQFEVYEPPHEGLLIDVGKTPEQIVDQIMKKLPSQRTQLSQVGLIGLGVMGTSLARNIAGKGFSLSIFNRHVPGKEEGIAAKAVASFPELMHSKPFDDLTAFVGSVAQPRKIILMVNAGHAVDGVIAQLLPLLSTGDVVVDGGNSFFKDTEARQKQLEKNGIHFMGTGISGGEEGALLGPSIMPGGSRQGFETVSEVLHAIAARNESGEVCCEHIGKGGAGHFVKMVHNGIEYAEMQLIAEFYSHLRYDQNRAPEVVARIFETWNRGEGSSYLLGITIEILRFRDTDEELLLDKISDVAGNKGTGGWTTIAACELGVAIPAMAEALFSRYVSSVSKDRQVYADYYVNTGDGSDVETESLFRAYMFCRIMNHYQGIKLISEASDNFGWDINISMLMKTWSAGCIIRSSLLAIFRKEWLAGQPDILQLPYARDFINSHMASIKHTISVFIKSRYAYPVASSCLEYFKGLVTTRGNGYLIQAQRDYFGAHTYRRIDDAEGASHHTQWSKGS